MAAVNLSREFDLEQDLRHERREWRIERFAWVIFALILIAALSGLLGEGPLSRAEVESSGAVPLAVHYERFARRQLPTQINLRLANGLPDAAPQILINRAYLDNVDVHSIVPEPSVWSGNEEWVALTFNTLENARPLDITPVSYTHLTLPTSDLV